MADIKILNARGQEVHNVDEWEYWGPDSFTDDGKAENERKRRIYDDIVSRLDWNQACNLIELMEWAFYNGTQTGERR